MFVAKGTAVHYSAWSMHRLPKIYGDEAETFNPGRWLDAGKPLRPGGDTCHSTAGCGCVWSQQSALVEGWYAVTRLVQQFGRIEARRRGGGRGFGRIWR